MRTAAALVCISFASSIIAADPTPNSGLTPAARQPDTDLLAQATALFNEATKQPKKFAEAAAMFARAMANKVDLSPKQSAAWAYCRVRVAAERLNAAPQDKAVAAEVAAEVADALALAPDYAELQKFGRTVLIAAGRPDYPPTATAVGWQVIETDNFRVRFPTAAAEAANAAAKRAEEQRAAIFTRWSGPAGGAWRPKCEVVIHPTAAALAAATKQPADATGHALVRLDGGRATERRIDLRADDATLADDALPRELTHVVLADLFPVAAPPRWAPGAMAVLAASGAEVDRYRRAAPDCLTRGELWTTAALLAAADVPPADKFTGFAVGGVVLADYLVRWKGEKAFTTFLRDCQRYGTESALKRQYGVATPAELDALVRKDFAAAR